MAPSTGQAALASLAIAHPVRRAGAGTAARMGGVEVWAYPLTAPGMQAAVMEQVVEAVLLTPLQRLVEQVRRDCW